MSGSGPEAAFNIRRHAARPHRLRGQHRATWAAELSPLFDDTQRRCAAVVGAAAVGASAVAITTAAALPSGQPDPAASQAVAEIASITAQASEARTGHSRQAPPPTEERTGATVSEAEETAPVPEAADLEHERRSPVTSQPAQVRWSPMLDHITITSLYGPRWGRNHNGVDFSAATGTPIYAAFDGTVRRAGWESGFGYLVIIDHGDGVQTYYAHNSQIHVVEGQWVESGQHISDAGNTGFSFGSHLHFEVHVDGRPVEPLGYLEEAGLELA
jgi:murein DD-endopeptidase MepM/ murein hydrolase activator NlpD